MSVPATCSLVVAAALAPAASAAPTIDGEFDVPGLGSNNKLVEVPTATFG